MVGSPCGILGGGGVSEGAEQAFFLPLLDRLK